jgi:hypothetical protein
LACAVPATLRPSTTTAAARRARTRRTAVLPRKLASSRSRGAGGGAHERIQGGRITAYSTELSACSRRRGLSARLRHDRTTGRSASAPSSSASRARSSAGAEVSYGGCRYVNTVSGWCTEIRPARVRDVFVVRFLGRRASPSSLALTGHGYSDDARLHTSTSRARAPTPMPPYACHIAGRAR